MSSTNEPLVDRQEAALRASVTYQTILLWERAGRLHPVRSDDTGAAELLIRVSELDHVSARSRAATDPTMVWRPDELTVWRPGRT
jgi:hypothetical protein